MQSVVTVGIFAVLLAIGAGWFFWRAVRTPYKGYTEQKKRVDIRRGLRTSSILQQLQKEGVLRAERITWTGHVRDTAVFSILAEEWAEIG